MGSRVSRYLLMSQVSFLALLAICVAITPGFLFERDEGGVSNFGVTPATRIPYTLAFLMCATFLLLAGHATPRRPPILDQFRRALFILGTLFVLVLVSTYPYKVNATLKDIHIMMGVLLIAFELAISSWLTFAIPRNSINILLLLIQAAGCLLALATLIGALHLLFLAQLMASAAFGVLLVRAGQQLVQRSLIEHQFGC